MRNIYLIYQKRLPVSFQIEFSSDLSKYLATLQKHQFSYIWHVATNPPLCRTGQKKFFKKLGALTAKY